MDSSNVINKILEVKHINAKVLSEMIGLERPQAIYDIIKGKTKSISISMASKIISVFPEFNKAWILTGEGDMYTINSCSDSTVNEPQFPYGNIQNSDQWLKGNIDKLIEDNGRNSRSIEKMVETADRNSQTLARLVDLLVDNGIDIRDKIKKGDSSNQEEYRDDKPYREAAG